MKAKVCVDCQRLTPNLEKARCQKCASAHNKQRMLGTLYTTEYQQERNRIIQHALANNTPCHLCASVTPPEIYNGTPSADHETAGDRTSRLLYSHLGCNSARGNRTVQEFRDHLLKRLPNWLKP